MNFTSANWKFILKLYLYKGKRFNLIYINQVAKQAIERFYLYEKKDTIS